MGNIFEDGANALLDDFAESASVRVKYTQGTAVCQWSATLGRHEYQTEDEMGIMVTRWTDLDFHGRASDLIIGGDPVIPAPGDTIELFRGRDTETYEVLPVDRQCYKLDPTQQKITIFTKRINKA